MFVLSYSLPFLNQQKKSGTIRGAQPGIFRGLSTLKQSTGSLLLCKTKEKDINKKMTTTTQAIDKTDKGKKKTGATMLNDDNDDDNSVTTTRKDDNKFNEPQLCHHGSNKKTGKSANTDRRPKKPVRENTKRIINNMVTLLEKGITPFRPTWSSQYIDRLPCNVVTGSIYTGVNRWLLLGHLDKMNKALMEEAGIADEQSNGGITKHHVAVSPYFVTFNDAKKLGMYIKKGSKAIQLLRYIIPKDQEEEEANERRRFFFDGYPKYFHVFHFETCCEGDDELMQEIIKSKTPDSRQLDEIHKSRFSRCDAIIERLKDEISIKHEGALPRYDKKKDIIYIPHKTRFSKPEDYYATLFHMMAHWAMSPARYSASKNPNIPESAEELIAEIVSASITTEVGISPSSGHEYASHCASWAKLFKSDPSLLTLSVRCAQAITSCILGEDAKPTTKRIDVSEAVKHKLKKRSAEDADEDDNAKEDDDDEQIHSSESGENGSPKRKKQKK